MKKTYMQNSRIKTLVSEYSLILVFILICVICMLVTDFRFTKINNIMVILRNTSIIGMISLGMTYVIISGGIDLSSGPVLAASGTVLIMIQRSETMPVIVAILACCAVAMVIGFVNGIIITKAKLPPFIVTLAIGIIARSIAVYICSGATIRGRNVPEFTNIGNGSIGVFPIPFIIIVASVVLMGMLLHKSRFGSYVYAVGGNEKAAVYSGINADRIKIITYMLAGLCVGVASVIETSRMAAIAPSTSGHLYEFEAITAVIVGGTSLAGGRGRIIGTVIGFLILGVVTNMMLMMNISPYLNGALKGCVILIAVLLQKKNG